MQPRGIHILKNIPILKRGGGGKSTNTNCSLHGQVLNQQDNTIGAEAHPCSV